MELPKEIIEYIFTRNRLLEEPSPYCKGYLISKHYNCTFLKKEYAVLKCGTRNEKVPLYMLNTLFDYTKWIYEVNLVIMTANKDTALLFPFHKLPHLVSVKVDSKLRMEFLDISYLNENECPLIREISYKCLNPHHIYEDWFLIMDWEALITVKLWVREDSVLERPFTGVLTSVKSLVLDLEDSTEDFILLMSTIFPNIHELQLECCQAHYTIDCTSFTHLKDVKLYDVRHSVVLPKILDTLIMDINSLYFDSTISFPTQIKTYFKFESYNSPNNYIKHAFRLMRTHSKYYSVEWTDASSCLVSISNYFNQNWKNLKYKKFGKNEVVKIVNPFNVNRIPSFTSIANEFDLFGVDKDHLGSHEMTF